MTEEIARKLAAIFATADGGCAWCAEALAKRAKREWPEFDWEGLTKEACDA